MTTLTRSPAMLPDGAVDGWTLIHTYRWPHAFTDFEGSPSLAPGNRSAKPEKGAMYYTASGPVYMQHLRRPRTSPAPLSPGSPPLRQHGRQAGTATRARRGGATFAIGGLRHVSGTRLRPFPGVWRTFCRNARALRALCKPPLPASWVT